jgi:hypothetical protein
MIHVNRLRLLTNVFLRPPLARARGSGSGSNSPYPAIGPRWRDIQLAADALRREGCSRFEVDDLSFARYHGRSLAADERLRPFLRDSGKREERRVYALDRLDASAFTTGNDLPVNRQTLFGCQMYYRSILFGQTKSGKTRAARVKAFPPYSEQGTPLSSPCLRDRGF